MPSMACIRMEEHVCVRPPSLAQIGKLKNRGMWCLIRRMSDEPCTIACTRLLIWRRFRRAGIFSSACLTRRRFKRELPSWPAARLGVV